jgi:D-arabinose 1-dehydrogenase-like Zn-dependent alcohol dehydrogenase
MLPICYLSTVFEEEVGMKGVVFLGDRKLELREFPDPTPGPREVVIEIKASGMCGSDLHVYRASFKPGDTQSGFKRGAEPVIAGHGAVRCQIIRI